MKRQPVTEARYFLPSKAITVVGIILSVIVVTTSASEEENNFKAKTNKATVSINKDSTESVEAFMQVYKVLMSPRCMNCHPAGDRPLQGEDSHVHIMNVQRGKDGKGLYALKCSNCHQPTNVAG